METYYNLFTTTWHVRAGIPRPDSSTIVSAIQTRSSAHRQHAPRSIIQAWPRNRAGELDLPVFHRSCRIPDQLPSSSTESPSKVSSRSLRVETNKLISWADPIIVSDSILSFTNGLNWIVTTNYRRNLYNVTFRPPEHEEYTKLEHVVHGNYDHRGERCFGDEFESRSQKATR